MEWMVRSVTRLTQELLCMWSPWFDCRCWPSWCLLAVSLNEIGPRTEPWGTPVWFSRLPSWTWRNVFKNIWRREEWRDGWWGHVPTPCCCGIFCPCFFWKVKFVGKLQSWTAWRRPKSACWSAWGWGGSCWSGWVWLCTHFRTPMTTDWWSPAC